jgi:hypothetical protein
MKEVVISLTSWIKRIHLVNQTIESILKNKLPLDTSLVIFMTLSTLEFPNKEIDLPENLLKLKNENKNIIINWVNTNYKGFKKLPEVVKAFYNKPNIILIDIDDDYLYDLDFIETCLYYEKLYPNNAITAWYANGQIDGATSITKPRFFKSNIWEDIQYGYDNCESQDIWTRVNLALTSIMTIDIQVFKNKRKQFHNIEPLWKHEPLEVDKRRFDAAIFYLSKIDPKYINIFWNFNLKL